MEAEGAETETAERQEEERGGEKEYINRII